MYKILLVSFSLLTSTGLFAQGSLDSAGCKEKNPHWDGLILDIGFNNFADAPDVLDLTGWKSRGVNIYYYLGIPIGSKFTLAPGIGVGLEGYVFQDESVRLSAPNDSLIIYNQSGFGPAVPAINYHKSKLAVNYADIPLELRFETGKFPKTFRIAIGGRAGILFNAHTKVKYTVITSDEERKEKSEGDFAINNFRYGLTARVGYKWLNLFGYYSLSDLFEENKGPVVTPIMIGLSFSPSYYFRQGSGCSFSK